MEHFVGGSLKLKGSSGSDLKKKKKKKGKDKEKIEKALDQEAVNAVASSSQPAIIVKHKTDAQLKFEEAQKKRLQEKVEKIAKTSHKERVAEFNRYLESLSEHYDMPRVGPG